MMEFGVYQDFVTRYVPLVLSVALPPSYDYPRLVLKLFRREPAISRFDWYFSAIHTSSPHFSTYVGSGLKCVSPHFQPGHGYVTWFRVDNHILYALFRLAFAAAPLLQFNLAWDHHSPVHSAKGTPSPINGL